ncbi:MAG: NADP-dependent methylenetetrahydromethanopterin/methylenetetrahydrofolate dehydrogenase [Methylohalobius sp.]|nr:NADP-dependent methylenetetrahydromethanopterin/methylenetetrahydrofolate dehydrogenase [Methylohalobius sp.]
MKKILLQLDTDPYFSSFDAIVAYDGGADCVLSYGCVTPEKVGPLVEGAIFTRAAKDKKNTAIFIGGRDLLAGQALLAAVKTKFFGEFRVSVMLDSNGSNTTAAAGVAQIAASTELSGKKAVVLAGTGPVGQRAAALLAKEGAEVTLTSRELTRAEEACLALRERFGVEVIPLEAKDFMARAEAIAQAHIVFAAGKAGVCLLEEAAWRDNPNLEVLLDANATPPLGIAGIVATDRGKARYGKLCFGALGFGSLKLALHKACIAQLFERPDLILDAEEIYVVAKSMAQKIRR